MVNLCPKSNGDLINLCGGVGVGVGVYVRVFLYIVLKIAGYFTVHITITS